SFPFLKRVLVRLRRRRRRPVTRRFPPTAFRCAPLLEEKPMSALPRSLLAVLFAAGAVACADSSLTAPPTPLRPPAVAQHDESCNPEVAIVPCDDPSWGGPVSHSTGYALGISMAGCSAPAPEDDIDLDLFSDNCEFILATAFAPKMMMNVQLINLNAA